MAAIFQTRIRHIKLTLSPFSSEQMSNIGSVYLDAMLTRIKSGTGADDTPAPPLNERYAHRKMIRNRAPIRDWTYRGLTLRSAKVKVASENKVTLGFISAQADMIAGVNNRRFKQWGVSPRDAEAGHAAIYFELTQHRIVRVDKGGYYGSSFSPTSGVGGSRIA